MTKMEERVLIYTALAVVCSFAAAFVGFTAAGLTFIQIAALIEALFWFGLPKQTGNNHREHRILFNGH